MFKARANTAQYQNAERLALPLKFAKLLKPEDIALSKITSLESNFRLLLMSRRAALPRAQLVRYERNVPPDRRKDSRG